MTVELKIFGVRIEPKEKALKEFGDLPVFGEMIRARNKTAAQAIALGEFLTMAPDQADNYFKPKVWEDRAGLPRMQLQAGFCTEFFKSVANWNPETGEPEFITPEPTEMGEGDDVTQPTMIVKNLDQQSRAICLALFGPVTEISTAQYGQVVDLKNDDVSSFARELGEAISRTQRIMALEPERQSELLAYLRDVCKESAQWPDIKKKADKYLDTPPDKREVVNRTPSGADAGGRNKTDRRTPQTKTGLAYEIAAGLLARIEEFDIYNVPFKTECAINVMMNDAGAEEYLATLALFETMPGGMDYSRACNIATVKTTPEGLWKDPVKHREHLNRVMIESDHANPDPLILDIACGRSSVPMPMRRSEDPTSIDYDTSPRELDIKGQIVAALCGNTTIMDADEAGELLGLLGIEQNAFIEALSFDLYFIEQGGTDPVTDDEIHHLTCDALHKWDKVPARRVQVLEEMLAIYRQDDTTVLDDDELREQTDKQLAAGRGEYIPGVSDPADPKWVTEDLAKTASNEGEKTEVPPPATVVDLPVITARPRKPQEPGQPAIALTYEQQLTIAALRGMCANPAYCGNYEDIPSMAVWLSSSVVREQEASDE